MIYSNCKINMGLNILEKRADGYHELDMTMIPISFSDILTYEDYNEAGDLILETNDRLIPVDERNTIRKAYNFYFENTNLEKPKVKIFLEKNVPHEAGLGGGSSNAAFILKKLNEKYNIYKEDSLEKIALKVGADVPFFIKNKSARVKGIGEKIEIIENNLKSDILLIKPQIGMSTEKIYSYYTKYKDDLKMADIGKIVLALKENDLKMLENNIENSLEQLIYIKDQKFYDLKKYIEDNISKKIYLSGSGSCFFTFGEKEKMNLEKINKKEFFCKFSNSLQ